MLPCENFIANNSITFPRSNSSNCCTYWSGRAPKWRNQICRNDFLEDPVYSNQFSKEKNAIQGGTNMNTAVTATSQGTKPTEWQIDPAHAAAHFSVRHLMISNVRGEFSKLSGSVLLDPADLTRSTVEVSLHTASINT